MSDGGGKAGAKKGLIERFDLVGKKAEGDLRSGAKVSGSDGNAAMIEHRDRVAWTGVFGTVDVGSVNPDVASGKTFGGAALNTKGGTLLHVPPV